ncbi:MAG TPA: WD40 repeat domain-containing protein [Pyrinomonadaceae bacterium]
MSEVGRFFVSLLLCCFLLSRSIAAAGQGLESPAQRCFEPRAVIQTSAWLTGIYFSPSGRLVTQRGRKRLKVWDVSTGRVNREYTGNDNQISAVAFSLDGSRIAAGDRGSKAWVWETATGRLVARFETKQNDEISELALAPDGKLLATIGEGGCYWTNTCNTKVKLWDVEAGRLKATLSLPSLENVIFSKLAFSPDGKTLATVLEWKAALWDAGSGELRAKLIDPASGGSLLHEAAGDSPREIAFSPNGRVLAVLGFYSGHVKLWDVGSGKLIASSRELAPGEAVRSICFSADGRLMAWGGFRKQIKIYDLEAGKVVRIFRGDGRIKSVSFSPDGRLLAASDDSNTHVWETASGRLQQKLAKSAQAVFSPDGRTLATSYDDDLTLRDVSCR